MSHAGSSLIKLGPIEVMHPALWPPRAAPGFGDYSVRDLAAKFLMQVDDLAEHGRYRLANAEEQARAADGRRRVVLMGDSITDFWTPDLLPQTPAVRFINRGIAGQNTSVMPLRFQSDVAALSPDAVVLLGGTNDVRAYAGDPAGIAESGLEGVSRNIAGMADMAIGRGSRVILATLPPIGPDFLTIARSPAVIDLMNQWTRGFASDRDYPLADYHAALADGRGLMPAHLSDDGVHPNAAAYRLMAPGLEAVFNRLFFSDLVA